MAYPDTITAIHASVSRWPVRRFTGAALKEVAFPLGGIGTGTVSLGGRGDLRDWEIFNRPAKGSRLPFTFFALWAKAEGRPSVARVLERQLLPPFVAQQGLFPSQYAGLPRLREATFSGAYPFAHIAFTDPTLPVTVDLLAYNPMIPLDAERSGLPVAIFRWRLFNPGPESVECTLAYSQYNPVGYDGQARLHGRRHALFGGNLNAWRDEAALRGFLMSRPGFNGENPYAGSLAIATPWQDVTFSAHWERAGWWDDLQNFWDDFRSDGRLPDDPSSDPTAAHETDVSTLGLRVRLGAGEAVDLPIVLAWHFPNLTNYWNQEPSVRGKRLGNYYTTRFADAWDAAQFTIANLEPLTAETRAFQETLFASTLPSEALDAVSSQMSIIRTTTCLRTEDGRFHGFEGCNDDAGCCPMNCTHVWNYEQALAYLYPDLERSMRLTDFGVNTLPDGEQRFRTLIPLSSGTLWNFVPAADGQMGNILKLYREWQISGDDDFLRQLWPAARRSLEWAWQHWDRDRDGVMEGEQHNTYDIEFYGPNTMMGTLYLGALRAAAIMARAVGDDEAAAEFERVFASGTAKLDELLWNGEFYVQQVRNPTAEDLLRSRYPGHLPSGVLPGEDMPRYQYGPGCLSDHMLGQWFAHVVGLGYVLPPERVRTAMHSIYRYNWRTDLHAHESCQRTYALNDEAGLVLCSWPNGGRPRYPFPYADEVWTGIEYQVAAHLIYEGLVEEGLNIVRGLRARHDGIRRNPWDEFECGHHYARAMASWSLLLALSGYAYSAPERRLGFAPRVHADDFRCFFTTGSGWGSYNQQRTANSLACQVTVRRGQVALRWLEIGLPEGVRAEQVTVAGREAARVAGIGTAGRLRIDLGGEVVVSGGETLAVTLQW